MPLQTRTREIRKPISIPPRIPAGLPEAMVAGGIIHGRILFGLPGHALALGALGANGGFPAAVRRMEGNDLRNFVDICAHDCPLYGFISCASKHRRSTAGTPPLACVSRHA